MSNADEFIAEVDEELRRDTLADIWRQYGGLVMGAAAAVVIGVAGHEGWGAYQKHVSAKGSQAYAAALEAAQVGNLDLALARIVEAESSGAPGYKAVAGHLKAEVLLRKGDQAGAVKALEAAALEGSDRELRALAVVKAGYLVADTESADALRKRLAPALATPGPLADTAREMLGMKALDEGRFDEARTELSAVINSVDAPEMVRGRAEIALTMIPEPSAAVPAAPKAAAVPAKP